VSYKLIVSSFSPSSPIRNARLSHPRCARHSIGHQHQTLEDTKHYLTLDNRFRGLLFEIKHLGPGRQRRQILGLLWTRVYSGYHVGDLDALQARSFALDDYLCTLDELCEAKTPTEDCDTSLSGCSSLSYRVRRSSAVSGMGVLALE
jgi:hypothetical protein